MSEQAKAYDAEGERYARLGALDAGWYVLREPEHALAVIRRLLATLDAERAAHEQTRAKLEAQVLDLTATLASARSLLGEVRAFVSSLAKTSHDPLGLVPLALLVCIDAEFAGKP